MEMLFRGILWMIVTVCVGAYDHYDDRHQKDYEDERIYHDDGSNEISLELLPEGISNDLVLLKIIKSMRDSNDRISKSHDRSNIHPEENGWVNLPQTYSEVESKSNPIVVKKLSPQNHTNASNRMKVKPVPRRQRKWKIKAPLRLCLLKVCSMWTYVYE